MRHIETLAQKLYATRCCPYWMPWFSGDERIRRLKRAGLRALRKSGGPQSTGLLSIARAALWPAISLLQAFNNSRSALAEEIASASGAPRKVSQFIHQLVLAWRHNISPFSYFEYCFFDRSNRARASQYFINPPLYRLLDTLGGGNDITLLNDKYTFFTRCRAAGLPVADITALVQKEGEIKWCVPLRNLPAKDLFLKPRNLLQGIGAQLWRFDGSCWLRDGARLTEAELMAHLRRSAVEGDYLVMPVLRVLEELAPLTSGALPTLRIVTCHTTGGPVHQLTRHFRMGGSSKEVDSYTAGGIAAPVDINGQLGPGLQKSAQIFPCDSHPVTGRRITGTQLPLFNNATALCERAHREFQEVPTIGWDIAFTPDGLKLLEANPYWGAHFQGRGGEPLGDTPFLDWAATHLDWLQEEASRQARNEVVENDAHEKSDHS